LIVVTTGGDHDAIADTLRATKAMRHVLSVEQQVAMGSRFVAEIHL
jgi:hypothetical protein